jgi:hypothetical protein
MCTERLCVCGVPERDKDKVQAKRSRRWERLHEEKLKATAEAGSKGAINILVRSYHCTIP